MKINEKSEAIGYFVKLRDLVLELEELDYTAWYDENILGGKLQKEVTGILEQGAKAVQQEIPPVKRQHEGG